MEFLFVPYQAHGHVAPMLAVASRLAARGVRVRMVAGRQFAASVRSAGVVPVDVHSAFEVRVLAGWGCRDVAERHRLWLSRRRLASDMAAVCHGEIARMGAGVVVVDPHMAWTRNLRLPERVRMAWVCTTSGRRIPRGASSVLVNGVAELLGDAVVGDRVRFIGPLLGALSVPDPGIPWDRVRGTRVLVAAAGTVFTQSVEQLRSLVAAFADSEWTVVLATGRIPAAALGRLPNNVLAYSWIPQAEVLGHADMFLTHGGMNSVLEAMACGVPMVVHPRIAEQRRSAVRLEKLGVAKVVSFRAGLRERIEQVADDRQIRMSVSRLRQKILEAPTADRAADELLALAWVV
ncbi:nucleotide disphospho-sugar-binding domain-containing protein [Amycolatopsis sp. cmx-11-51]|uniref:nucleotide disphospho-sugar-binding domain-containing protein n=1 Tax=Amycolatopsis sp. cmx-11-51 TaxID=2785797 RepID=UPI0039E63992